jgi:hypothetical protein
MTWIILLNNKTITSATIANTLGRDPRPRA